MLTRSATGSNCYYSYFSPLRPEADSALSLLLGLSNVSHSLFRLCCGDSTACRFALPRWVFCFLFGFSFFLVARLEFLLVAYRCSVLRYRALLLPDALLQLPATALLQLLRCLLKLLSRLPAALRTLLPRPLSPPPLPPQPPPRAALFALGGALSALAGALSARQRWSLVLVIEP
jgi:hypothetical protein